MIRTPDQRLRVFVSSTLGELADERRAVRRAVEQLHLTPVMFELGARPHPPRDLYRAYLDQSDVFVGIYWQRYGWVAPGEDVSGLEDEYRLAHRLPQLLYIKEPAPDRESALTTLLGRIQDGDAASYRRFSTPEGLEELVAQDLAVLLSERFDVGRDRRLVTPPVALPALLTPTVGRREEVEAVVELLEGAARLVTLTGPGGVGKTRLALEVAHVVAGRPGAEVSFVPLAGVPSAASVMAAVADRLGVRGGTGLSPFDSLRDALRERAMTLVLDNLEQVVAVGPELVRLLEQVPGLQVIATSRQALRVVGEHDFPVAPLGVPAEAASLEAVLRAPAVELLVERARARGVGLHLDGERAAAVAALCRRLAGLPLAIELVVPRLRFYRPAELLDRLGSPLDLPPAGEDLPTRQRTLRATLMWSHALLDEAERILFARLGVFAGGATLEAVEAVCADSGDSVEQPLAGLLDKSLLRVDDPSSGGEPRIQMLEPIRDFAREQLEALDGTEALRKRHQEYVVGLGRRARPFLCGPRQREWAARFDAERADVRAAISTGLESEDLDAVLRLTWDTLVYYYVRDALDEPRQWLSEVARRGAGLTVVQRALLDVALLIVEEPDSQRDPILVLEEAGGDFDRAGLALEAAVARHYRGLHLWQAGRHDDARASLEDASRRYAAIDHDWGVATVEMTLGAALASVERREPARGHLSTALLRARGIDNSHQVAQALQGLALVDALDGRPDDALRSLAEAVPLVLADRWVTGATYCLEAVGAVLLALGDPAGAVDLVALARATRARRQIPEWTAASEAAEPVLVAARRMLGEDAFDDHGRSGAENGADVLALLDTRLSGLRGEAELSEVAAAPRA
jgi:predicted ATPase